MIVKQLIELLESNHESPIRFQLPTGTLVPEHFHVTEVGRLQKTFIDCGGTRRESTSCMLQAWVANDLDHRLAAGKLAKILKLAEPILAADTLPIEVEYGADIAAQYVVANVEVTSQGLLFILSGKQTACLALDKCGINSCEGSGCC